MKREDAERLLHHHYRLHTQVRSTIDNKPPKSMFISPKSSHYKPFATRKPKSLEGTPNPPRRRGQEELAHFLAHKHAPKIPTSLNSSFNAYARKSMSNLASLAATPSTSASASSSRPSTSKTNATHPMFDRSTVKSKILGTRTYQPPIRRSTTATSTLKSSNAAHSMLELSKSFTGISLNNGTRSSNNHLNHISQQKFTNHSRINVAATNGRSSSAMTKNNMDLYRQKYKDFKEVILSDILRRGIFTDRVIKDSFYREIERRTDLDLSQMEMIMFDTLSELGVKTNETAPAPPPSRAKRPKTAKQRSFIGIENGIDGGGGVLPDRTPVVDFNEQDMYIPDDKTSQISSLPSNGTLSSASSSSTSPSSSSSSSKSSSSSSTTGTTDDDEEEEVVAAKSESDSTPESHSEEEKLDSQKNLRTPSLLSESSFDYKIPPMNAYRFSSSSELEEHIKNREDKMRNIYNFKHYGREMSLDREEEEEEKEEEDNQTSDNNKLTTNYLK